MASITTIDSSIERGCGTRAEGGLYICVPTGSSGIPVEAFVLDPPIPWNEGPFRGARLHKRDTGVTDLLLWVGAEYYPTVADFVVEGARHGFSKRVPVHREADYSSLDQDSRILLIHPRAIVKGSYELRPVLQGIKPLIQRPDPQAPRDCTHALRRVEDKDTPDLSCTFCTWDLGVAFDTPAHRIIERTSVTTVVQTPSVQYSVMTPLYYDDPVEYSAGVILQLPFHHFEYVSRDSQLPDSVASAVGQNRNRTVITPT